MASSDVDPAKVQLQLSMDQPLRDRLKRFSSHTGIPMSRVISTLLETHLTKLEAKHGVQQELPL